MPIPDKRDLRRFCELDGWEPTSAHSPDHDRYRKKLDTGEILRTRVSRGRGPVCHDISLWARIWRSQLQLVSEEEFWEVLRSREPARRGACAPAEPPGVAMDTWLLEFLVNVVGMREEVVLALSPEEAMALYLRRIGGPTST